MSHFPVRSRVASLLLRWGASVWLLGTASWLAAQDDVSAFGIRQVVGKHLTLYTDIPPAADIDELPAVFDKAIPYWCSYFNVTPSRVESWHSLGYLMRDKDRFRRANLLPADLPSFLHGYQRGKELWVYEQESEYYRRHLLLHEGTHGFMNAFLGGAGPPWYMEGVAELMATHRWQNPALNLHTFPADKEEFEGWGRIKIIRDAVERGEPKKLEEIMRYDGRAHAQVEPYGWSWAAAAFLDGHPLYRTRFRDMQQHVRQRVTPFAERFTRSLDAEWGHLTREWQLFVSRVDYGYDVAREAIVTKPVIALPPGGLNEVSIAADRGWQSTGYRLEAGTKYRFQASGRYQLATKPKPWWCEPNGVTIRYYAGRPLGVVLGAIVEEGAGAGDSNGFLSPAAIGLELETTLRRGGTLYLRVNDSPAELADNQGQVKVQVSLVP